MNKLNVSSSFKSTILSPIPEEDVVAMSFEQEQEDPDVFRDEDSLTDLISLKSFGTGVCPPILEDISTLTSSYSEEASFEVQCAKRMKFDEEVCGPINNIRETVVELHAIYQEVVVNDDNKDASQEKEEVLKAMDKLKKKTVSDKNSIAYFKLVTKHQILQNDFTPVLNSFWNTVTLKLESIAFDKVPKRKKCFLLITCGSVVLTSTVIKSTQFNTTFTDCFFLENCSKDFKIKIMLYTLKNAQSKPFIIGKLYNWYRSKICQSEIEMNNFEFIQQISVTAQDLVNPTSKFTLSIEDFNTGVEKKGNLWHYLEEEDAWQKFWGVLSKTTLILYKKKGEDAVFSKYDLKWMTYSKINDDDKTLSFQYVITEAPGGRLHKHMFKTVNINSMKLWMRDINLIIDCLIEWNSSILALK